MRLAVVTSHPVQYQAPLFRELSRRCDTHVLFAHRATRADQAAAGFGVDFDWDVDLLSGYQHTFLENVSRTPNLESFAGCDTPGIDEAIGRLAPDAVVLMGWHLKCYWQAIRAARRRRIPVMVRGDSHLKTPRSRLKRTAKQIVYPIALRAFDAALYVGEHSRRYWEHYRYPADRMFFSPHCVDNDWFAVRATPEARAELRAANGIAPDAKVALFAGKLVPFKRPLDLVAAAGQLARAGYPVTVMIAGAGELERATVAAATEAGVPTVMLGFCNQSRMPAVYAAADVLVLASDHHETWGLVANEALACGRPIVVSDACGCAPDLAADGTAGRTFRCGDVASLADAIADVRVAPPSRAAIVERIDRYSIAVAADGVLAAAQARARTLRKGVPA
jgi:glycosyltransferase involved in cell wall biosynthesis